MWWGGGEKGVWWRRSRVGGENGEGNVEEDRG